MKALLSLVILASETALAATSHPLVIAHRGASGYLPEHTLAAKAMAYGMGADFIEQDVVLSKDGVAMVLHDIYLDTVTDVAQRHPGRARDDGRYYALDFTLAELKQLRVTERIDVKTGQPVFPKRFPAGPTSFQVSTLEEELQLIQGLRQSTGRQVGVYPEIKQPAWHREQGHDLSRTVLSVLERFGYRTKTDACWIQCFDFEEVKRLRHELGWSGNLVWLLEAGESGDRGPDGVERRTLEGWQAVARTVDGIGPAIGDVVMWTDRSERVVTDLVENAHAAGLVVHPYTIRLDALPPHCPSVDELHAALFTAAGVDGAFTDFPDATVRWRERTSRE